MGLLGSSTNSETKPLLKAIDSNDLEKVSTILSIDNKKSTVININDKNKDGNTPFLLAVKKDNFDIANSIIKYAIKNKILLDIEEQNKIKEYPLLVAAKNNNMRIVYLIFDYANTNNIILNIEIKGGFKSYPFFYAVKNNNTEMAKLFIDYADDNEILLDINDKNELNEIPLIISLKNYNIDMTSLILNYYKKYKIRIELECPINGGYYYDMLLGMYEDYVDSKKLDKKDKQKQKQIILMNRKKNLLKKDNKNNTEAVVLYDFKSSSPKDLSISKGEHIIVTDWIFEDGWAFGYKKSNPEEYGKIPKQFIKKYIEDNFEGDLVAALYDFKGNSLDELEFKKNDYLRILNWNAKDGWIYGYVEGNCQKKGLLPKTLIRKVYYDNQDNLPSYEEIIKENKEE